MTPQRPEQRSEVPEHRGPQRKKDLWLASLVVGLQFQAAPESGGRQPQHPSGSQQPFLCARILHDAKDLSKAKAVATLSIGLSITK